MGQNTPVALNPLPMEDFVPADEEVAWVFDRIFRNRAGVTSRMRAEHLWYWVEATAREKSPDPTHCENVVGLIQYALCKLHLVE